MEREPIHAYETELEIHSETEQSINSQLSPRERLMILIASPNKYQIAKY